MFHTPIEVAQSQLRQLRVSMVDAQESASGLFPFFTSDGLCRFIFIDTARNATGARARETEVLEPNGLFVISEFPMEIRMRKAIYARPMNDVYPIHSFPAEKLGGLWYMDPWGKLLQHAGLPVEILEHLRTRNLALLERDGERFEEVCFRLDLRRVTGAATRRNFFRRRRLELPALRSFLSELDKN